MKAQACPAAILFDAGGILIDVTHRPQGYLEVARLVHSRVMDSTGVNLGVPRILADLKAAAAAYSSWKFAQSRRARPREITHREFWEDFVASDWPPLAQNMVAVQASELSRIYEESVFQRVPIEGGQEVLEAVKAAGIKTGVISNTLVGEVTRLCLQKFGLASYIDKQLYSDETGFRKPNPEMFHRAAACLNVSIGEAWYLGDRVDRDVLAGRRAGVRKVILMPDRYDEAGPVVAAEADVVITKLTDLLNLIPYR